MNETVEEEDLSSFGFRELQCVDGHLVKKNFDNKVVFRIALKEIIDLGYNSRFRWKNLMLSMILAGVTFFFWNWIDSVWARWITCVLFGFFSFCFLIDLRDKYVEVSTKDGKMRLEMEDSENEKDIEGFILSVKSKIRECKKQR